MMSNNFVSNKWIFGGLLLALFLISVPNFFVAAKPNSEVELVFGVFTPECYQTLISKRDFMHVDCLKFVVSKLLGYAIIVGSFLLKLPQIIKILAAKDVYGLSPSSFYLEVFIFASNTAYNLLRGYPISTWGENVVILAQNILLVVLLWKFSEPRLSVGRVLSYILIFFAAGAAMMNTPQEYQWVLVSAGIPLSVAARVPQIVANFKQGHTGQLALITLVLNAGGSVARVFTTLQETGDQWQLLGYGISLLNNLILILQILMYWNYTNKVLKQHAEKKSD